MLDSYQGSHSEKLNMKDYDGVSSDGHTIELQADCSTASKGTFDLFVVEIFS
jgi:hypothetical protein